MTDEVVRVQAPPGVQIKLLKGRRLPSKSEVATEGEKNVLVAQLVEQLTLNQWVQGSNPCQDTKNRGVAQLASAPRSGRGGRKFESSHPDFFFEGDT